MKLNPIKTESRRTFVGKAGIGFASMALAPKLDFFKSIPLASKVRIGIIGGRFGASFQPWKFLNFGIDVVAPFNKENPASIQNPVFSFGGELRPFKWLSLNAGYYAGGIYQSNIPLGITFIRGEGAYEFGISSRDAYTFFAKNKHGISTAFGFARFRF